MTGPEMGRKRESESHQEVQVSDAGRQWLQRWIERLRGSVSLRLHDGPEDLDEPEDVSELTVRQELAEEATILGEGLDRLAVVPPASVTLNGTIPDDDTDGEGGVIPFLDREDADVTEVVVKLPRPTEPGGTGGVEQNEAEVRVWDALMNEELYRFDAATGTRERVEADLFAPVLDAADDRSWLLMPRFDTVFAGDATKEERKNIVDDMEARFLEAHLRPDLSPTNIGVREDGTHVIIDYGMPNWVGEEGLW